MEILNVKGLNKSFGKIHAVNYLDLHLESGQVLGLLGPNGSGKTTTLGMLLGIIKPNSGSFYWFDKVTDYRARLRIGALLETPNFYPYLNADENLKIISKIKGVNENFSPLLNLVGLEKRRKSKFGTYSLGMKQRLAIASALVGNPDVLIFDEPANGLDPQGIAEVRSTITKIAEQGKTILMASHILDEVEKVCSHVAIMKNGRMLTQGPVGALLGDQVMVEVRANDLDLHDFISGIEGAGEVKKIKEIYHFQLPSQWTGNQINKMAQQKGITLSHLVVKKQSLESEFLTITKD